MFDADPVQVFNAFVKTYRSLDKSNFSIEEIKIYNKMDKYQIQDFLNFFDYEGVEELRDKTYDYLTYDYLKHDYLYIGGNKNGINDYRNHKFIAFLYNAIIGSTNVDLLHTVLFETETEFTDMLSQNNNDIEKLNDDGLEIIYYTGGDETSALERTLGRPWKEEIQKVSTNVLQKYGINVKEDFYAKSFVQEDETGKYKVIVIPKIEIEKIKLRIVQSVFKKDLTNLKVFSEEDSLSDFLQIYEKATELYQKPEDCVVVNHNARLPRIPSITFFSKMLKEKNINIEIEDWIPYAIPFWSDLETVYDMEINNDEIIIMPFFILKRPYRFNRNTARTFNSVLDEISEYLNERYEVQNFLVSRNGIYFRINGSDGINKGEETLVSDGLNIKKTGNIINVNMKEVVERVVKQLCD